MMCMKTNKVEVGQACTETKLCGCQLACVDQKCTKCENVEKLDSCDELPQCKLIKDACITPDITVDNPCDGLKAKPCKKAKKDFCKYDKKKKTCTQNKPVASKKVCGKLRKQGEEACNGLEGCMWNKK